MGYWKSLIDSGRSVPPYDDGIHQAEHISKKPATNEFKDYKSVDDLVMRVLTSESITLKDSIENSGVPKHIANNARSLIGKYFDALNSELNGETPTINHIALLEILRPTLGDGEYERLDNLRRAVKAYKRSDSKKPTTEYVA